MKLIVGLGNPGPEYHNTRHNIGFQIVEELVKNIEAPSFQSNRKLQAQVVKTNQIVVLKPQTFMNLSGNAVKAAAMFYKIALQDIWIIHDDMDIELGRIKVQIAGGSAGHNGIKSIISSLGSPDFTRWRIGVGKPDKSIQPTSDYVLDSFTTEEIIKLNEVINKATQSINYALNNDIVATMNKYN